MTEFTKETWSAKPDAFTGHDHPSFGWGAYVSNGQYIVAKAWGATDAEAKQRAHLIAAAPELYEALNELAATIAIALAGDKEAIERRLGKSISALRKARGEQ